MDETIGEMSLTTKLLDREDKPSPPSSSFIKRVQLIPRHKASEAEKRREEERRQRNNNAPLTLDSSAKLIRISGLRISGDQKPSSDCGVDDWLQWRATRCGRGDAHANVDVPALQKKAYHARF
uniref:Uncharacterized protein n=1 Tax=Globodera pallida TaxID=36090 RepID=A0A183C1Y9_GLOPA